MTICVLIAMGLPHLAQKIGEVAAQDYGLATLCLAKKAVPISQDGMVYSDGNINALLLARHTARKNRDGGGRIKWPSKGRRRRMQLLWRAFPHFYRRRTYEGTKKK